jgi:formate/nitrite transporter FocA (FNT family)
VAEPSTTHPRALAGIEGRLPPEIAEKAEHDGVAKAGQDSITLLCLGVLGGGFIAFGAIFATVALTGAEGALPFGIARVVAGLVFALGLSLVLIGGGQIFTGDGLMVMAWASGRLKAARILRVWTLVWIGNPAGSLGIAVLALLAGHHLFGAGQVGLTALRTAESKATLPFDRAFVLGMLCNTLVCLAVWLSLSSRLPAHRVFLDRVADSRLRCRGVRTCRGQYVFHRLRINGEAHGVRRLLGHDALKPGHVPWPHVGGVCDQSACSDNREHCRRSDAGGSCVLAVVSATGIRAIGSFVVYLGFGTSIEYRKPSGRRGHFGQMHKQ